MAEHRELLTSAIMSVVGALRVNPDRYAIIFDNSNNNNSNNNNSNNNNSNNNNSNNNNNEYLHTLIELAKEFFNGLLNNITQKTMVAATTAVKGE